MKRVLLLAFLLCGLKSFAQNAMYDAIYFTDGTTVQGKLQSIDDDKVKFENLANPGPTYNHSAATVWVAFNSTGSYLVFNQPKPFTDKEKQDFIAATNKPRSFDIVVNAEGAIQQANIADENEDTILCVNKDGSGTKLAKSSLVFVIKKDGSHEIFSSAETALPYLGQEKPLIDSLLSSESSPQAAANTTTPGASTTDASASATTDAAKKSPLAHDDVAAPDQTTFTNKALDKVTQFTQYLTAITQVKNDASNATKSIDLACDLFINKGEGVTVAVSNLNPTGATTIHNYKSVRNYLGRLMMKSGTYDQVKVEYAEINYASKFHKDESGDWLGVVTFVQKFQGFIDGNIAYKDQTKRSVTIHLKHYEKTVNGDVVAGWDVYLDNVGVVETKKL